MSGTAIGPDGPVANLGVRLVVPGDGIVSESEFDVATAVTQGRRHVRVLRRAARSVPVAREQAAAARISRRNCWRNPGLGAMFGGAPAQKGPTEMLFASANVSVANSDVDGVIASACARISCQRPLEFESQTDRPQPTAAQIAERHDAC